jgi:hypothetical protein
LVSALRRIEVVRPHLGEYWMEVCAEADCRDEELLAFANAEYGDGWTHVWRESEKGFGPLPCIHDRRRMHFVLVWGGTGWASLMG